MRDINLESTIFPRFTTRAFATGIPTTLAGTPVLSVYEENNLTQITAGVSLTVDYDGVTGLNQATIVATAANGYEIGKSYDLVITTGTVDSVSVVGEVVYSFTVEDTRIALIDDIWNESLAAHQTALTAGRAVTLGGVPIAETTVTGTPTSTSIQLTAGSTTDNFYRDQTFKVLSGLGAGQAKVITSYTGATKTCTFDEGFVVTPSAGDVVAIAIDHVHPVGDITSDILTTQMTESYAADGTAPTLAQAIFLIQQTIGDFSVEGTTLTAKKLDGSTTAATYTLNDPVNPSSRTRST